jgi:hypothetical protein
VAIYYEYGVLLVDSRRMTSLETAVETAVLISLAVSNLDDVAAGGDGVLVSVFT